MVPIDDPYLKGGTWLKGNVHSHTTASDGARDPPQAITHYAREGYDFLAISDHDTFVDPAEYRDATDVVLIPGIEVSVNGPHTLGLGIDEVVEPDEDRQVVIDAINEDNGIAIAAHPNWAYEYAHWPEAELDRVRGLTGVEIYNGLTEGHPGSSVATDRWDQLLSAGRRVWGVATDDAHGGEDVARGWVVVRVTERTPSAVLDALASGCFYASTGVTIRHIGLVGDEIKITTADADRIRLVSDYGRVQQVVDSPVASFHIPGHLVHGSEHTYVRLECLGRGGRTAWTQPFFLGE